MSENEKLNEALKIYALKYGALVINARTIIYLAEALRLCSGELKQYIGSETGPEQLAIERAIKMAEHSLMVAEGKL